MPGARLAIVAPVPPLLQLMFCGGVVVVTLSVAVPLLTPKQVTLVVAVLDVIPQGRAAIVSVYCNKAEQLLAS